MIQSSGCISWGRENFHFLLCRRIRMWQKVDIIPTPIITCRRRRPSRSTRRVRSEDAAWRVRRGQPPSHWPPEDPVAARLRAPPPHGVSSLPLTFTRLPTCVAKSSFFASPSSCTNGSPRLAGSSGPATAVPGSSVKPEHRWRAPRLQASAPGFLLLHLAGIFGRRGRLLQERDEDQC